MMVAGKVAAVAGQKAQHIRNRGFDNQYCRDMIVAMVSTSTGEVFGGHVAQGCIVRTTAEVLLALLPEWEFAREPDALTGYDELVVRARADEDNTPVVHKPT